MQMFLNCAAAVGFGWLMASMGYGYQTPQFWASVVLQIVLVMAGYIKD